MVALFVFLVCSQLPLYGIKTNAGEPPCRCLALLPGAVLLPCVADAAGQLAAQLCDAIARLQSCPWTC